MGLLRKATFVATGGASGLVIKANSKKERTAKALEKQLALQRQAMKVQSRQAPLATTSERPTQVDRVGRGVPRTWWLMPDAFEDFGPSRTLELGTVLFLGGKSDLPLPVGRWEKQKQVEGKSERLTVNHLGFYLWNAFPIPWDHVEDITFADGVLAVSTTNGDEVMFKTELAGDELELKLRPVLRHFNQGLNRGETASAGASIDVSLAAELERLAALHRDGALTDDEFQAAKARLIELK